MVTRLRRIGLFGVPLLIFEDYENKRLQSSIKSYNNMSKKSNKLRLYSKLSPLEIYIANITFLKIFVNRKKARYSTLKGEIAGSRAMRSAAAKELLV